MRRKRLPGEGGFVYFVGEDLGDLIKIGRTIDPTGVAGRLRGLQAQSPAAVSCFAAIPAIDRDDLNGAEKDLHLMFASERKHGEWFTRTERLGMTIDYTLRTYGEPSKPNLMPAALAPLYATVSARADALADWQVLVEQWFARYPGLVDGVSQPRCPLPPMRHWDCAGVEFDGTARMFVRIVYAVTAESVERVAL